MVWAALTEDGSRYPSLSTFYSHVRNQSLRSVLDGYFERHSVTTVIRILGLTDAILNEMLSKSEMLDSRASDALSVMRRNSKSWARSRN
jgi:hypothetical protein